MSDLFFFSYSRDNYEDGYLKLFFDELSAKIRERLGLGREERVGYLDQPELKLGASWRPELALALQTCRVMVSIYSPAYFRSPNCGREWEFFRRRRDLYVEKARARNEPALPPHVIKPVIWVPQLEDNPPPAVVGEMQYYMGGPDETHNKQGVALMRRQYNSFSIQYETFVDNLALEIIAANRLALPPLDPMPQLADLPNPFSPAPQPPPPQPPPPQPAAGVTAPTPPAFPTLLGRRGPRTVYFVFIAGDPNKFPENKRQPCYYIESGGGEWKPYYPDMEELDIFPLVQSEAGKLNFSAHELPYTDDLSEVVREAERRRSIVVLFVDSWTAELQEQYYKKGLSEFDEASYFNCSVFVPWNLKDAETKARVKELEEFLCEQVFPRWSGYGDDLYKNIYDVTELRETLKRTLSRLQLKLTKRAVEKAEITRPIKTDISRPVLSHKSVPENGAV